MTLKMEMLIVNRRIRQILSERGVSVYRTDVGTWLTVQEMAGRTNNAGRSVDGECIVRLGSRVSTGALG